MDTTSTTAEHLDYELRFFSLFGAGRSFAFPCDASGRVDLDSLSETARLNYGRICATVGREVSLPEVRSKPTRRER